jgi:hypothetical protein
MLSAFACNGGWAHEGWSHDKDDARTREGSYQGIGLEGVPERFPSRSRVRLYS